MNAAIHTLNKWASMNNEQIVRVRDNLLHISKASLTDIKGNRKNLYWFNKDLDRIYEYTGILQNTTADKLTTSVNCKFKNQYEVYEQGIKILCLT